MGTLAVQGARLWVDPAIADAEGVATVWSGQFVEDRRAFAELIGALADRIARAVHSHVTAAETRRALALPGEGLTAWEHYHAGLSDVFSPQADRIRAALARFRAAAALSPRFARALSAQPACHFVRAFTGMAQDVRAEVAAACRTAEAGLDADVDDPQSRWAYGRVLWLEGDKEDCRRHAELAVAISPGYACGHVGIAAVESMVGDAARAIRHIDMFLDLSPLDPVRRRPRSPGRMRSIGWATILAPAAFILAEAGDLAAASRITARLDAFSPDRGGPNLARSLATMSDDIARLHRRHGPRPGL